MENCLLVLGVGRSGTSSLGKGLAEQIGRYIPEPWRPKHPEYEKNSNVFFKNLENETNIVVKTLLIQKPIFYSESKLLDFFIELIDKFGINNTILIGRKNLQEHIVSQINLQYRVDLKHQYQNRVTAQQFHLNKHSIDNSWRIDDIPISYFEDKKLRSKILTELEIQNDNLFKVSEIFKKEIVWYEELYGENRNLSLDIIKSWKFDNIEINCKQLNNYLNPKYRYNKTKNYRLI